MSLTSRLGMASGWASSEQFLMVVVIPEYTEGSQVLPKLSTVANVLRWKDTPKLWKEKKPT